MWPREMLLLQPACACSHRFSVVLSIVLPELQIHLLEQIQNCTQSSEKTLTEGTYLQVMRRGRSGRNPMNQLLDRYQLTAPVM